MSRTFDHDTPWILLIIGYFGFHTLYRSLMGGALGLDEAQIVLENHFLSWGYGPQPPLYAWIQYFVSSLLGNNIFALALVKNTLLALTYLLLYRLLRSHFAPRAAGLAALSLLLLPQISWESQRALTHSVLTTFFAVATFVAMWGALRFEHKTRSYIALGLLIGFGVISKYNYAVVPLTLMLTAASLPQTRSFFKHPALLLTVLLAIIIPAKPIWWILENKSHSLKSLSKLGMSEHAGFLASLLKGSFSLVGALVGFSAVLVVVVAVFYHFYRREASKCEKEAVFFQHFLVRYLILSVVLLAAFVLLSGTTRIKDRWLQPQFAILAPAAILWLLHQISTLGKKRLGQLYLMLGAAIIMILPIHNFMGRAHRAAPFQQVAAHLEAGFNDTKPIILTSTWLAGNLKFVRPDWSVNDHRWLDQGGVPPQQFIVLTKGSNLQRVAPLLEAAGVAPVRTDRATSKHISFPYRYSDKHRLDLMRTQIRAGSSSRLKNRRRFALTAQQAPVGPH